MRQIVCIAGEPWQSSPTRTQQLMTRMKDAQILYFEPPAPKGAHHVRAGRRVRPNLIVYSLPTALTDEPSNSILYRYSRARAARFLQSVLEKHHFRDPVLWCASPYGAQFLEDISYRGLVYDCYRDWRECPDPWEGALTAAADVVFAASPDLMRRLMLWNLNVALLPFGCNYPMFAKESLSRPAALAGLRGPILGFVGTLWPDLDLTPLIRLAQARPDCSIVLVGADLGCAALPDLAAFPNVYLPGPADPVDLPDYLNAFQVCLYPLRRSELQSDILHSRLFEYLSSGKPIVAMLRPDQVEHFPDVIYGAHSPAEFAALCTRALEERGPWVRDRRREYGKAAAWSERANEVNRILESIGLFS